MLDRVKRLPGHDLWRALLRDEPMAAPLPQFSADLVQRFCGLFGASLINNALPGHLDPGLINQARLLNRLSDKRQGETVAELIRQGHPVLAMKGFATSRFYYRDRKSRVTGDVDLLLDPADLPAVVESLILAGFSAARDLPVPAWGFTSEASFLPMTSTDKLVDIDLHVLPDCYPLALGLSTREIIAEGRQFDLDGVAVPVPCAEHMLLIALSNATKEKFGPQSVKSLLDAGRILHTEPNLRWTLVEKTLRRAKLLEPARAAITAIRFLRGGEIGPNAHGRLVQCQLRDVLTDLATGFADGFPFHRKLSREFLLTAEPSVAFRRLHDRIRGLVFPRSGIPPGAENNEPAATS